MAGPRDRGTRGRRVLPILRAMAIVLPRLLASVHPMSLGDDWRPPGSDRGHAARVQCPICQEDPKMIILGKIRYCYGWRQPGQSNHPGRDVEMRRIREAE